MAGENNGYARQTPGRMQSMQQRFPQQSPMSSPYANSGLGRFGGGFQPYQPQSYQPQTFQPGQLAPRRVFESRAGVSPGAPGGMSSAAPGGGPGGYGTGTASQSGFADPNDGNNALGMQGAPVSNGMANAIGTGLGMAFGVPGLGLAAQGMNAALGQAPANAPSGMAAAMAQMDAQAQENAAQGMGEGGNGIGAGGGSGAAASVGDSGISAGEAMGFGIGDSGGGGGGGK